MPEIALNSIACVAGLVLLVWGADRFVEGASAIARNLGISPLLIGLTIVALGTSAPEMLVAGMAAAGGNTPLAIGNAIGSNITNVALVLGATALFLPLTVRTRILTKELPVLMLVSLGTAYLLWNLELTRGEGMLLLLAQLVFLGVLVFFSKQTDDPLTQEFDAEIPQGWSTGKAVCWFLSGLVVLLVGSKLLVWGAVAIALFMGVSDLVIGLTIVAIGTSLPELAASIAGARKGEHDIAVGNVVGSNVFNLLAVLGVAGTIGPSTFPAMVVTRDLPVMLGLTAALFILGFGVRGRGRISRVEGGVLLVIFMAYQLWLFMGVGA